MMEMEGTCNSDLTLIGISKFLIVFITNSYNVSKRVHRNDLEHIVTLIPLSLFNGLIMPQQTIGLLMVYFLGR